MGSILKLFNGFSFKEKSILISLLAVAVIYGGYFSQLLSGEAGQSMGNMLQSMIGIVIALVAVPEAVSHAYALRTAEIDGLYFHYPDGEQSIAARFGIRSIPTIAIFKGGRVVAQQAGAMDMGSLTRWAQAQLR